MCRNQTLPVQNIGCISWDWKRQFWRLNNSCHFLNSHSIYSPKPSAVTRFIQLLTSPHSLPSLICAVSATSRDIMNVSSALSPLRPSFHAASLHQEGSCRNGRDVDISHFSQHRTHALTEEVAFPLNHRKLTHMFAATNCVTVDTSKKMSLYFFLQQNNKWWTLITSLGSSRSFQLSSSLSILLLITVIQCLWYVMMLV